MTTKRLTERTAFTVGQVDRIAGVLRSALICGLTSANGRDYLPRSFGTGKQYEGKSIFVDHDTGGRGVADKLGWWQGVSIGANGTPRGDAHLLKTHPLYETVMEIAERKPSLLGFSHVARCETRICPRTGREQVESVDEVESVDLVAEPATVASIFESLNRGRKRPMLLKEYFDQLIRRTGKRLIEADDLGAAGAEPMPDDAPDPDTATPGADLAIAAAFREAGSVTWEAFCDGQLELAVCLAKLKKFAAALKQYGTNVTGDAELVGASESRKSIWSDLGWDDPAPRIKVGWDDAVSESKIGWDG